MPTICHQCTHNAGARKGLCSYCGKKKAKYCNDCAWWELGPVPNSSGLPSNMRKPGRLGRLVYSCPNVADERRDDLQEIRDHCDTIDNQLSGDVKLYEPDTFEQTVNKALKVYDDIYSKGLEDEAGYNKMMHTLIVVHMSAQLRAAAQSNDHTTDPVSGDKKRFVHRWDAPRIARDHLSHCFFHDDFIPAAKRPLAAAALRTEVVELVLRNKMSMVLAHRELRGLGANAAEAQEILRMAIMVYHAYAFVLRSPEVDVDAQNYFYPTQAYGWMSDEHRKALFGGTPGNPPFFTDATQKTLGTLHASLSATAPAGVRFADPAVQALVGNGITALHAAYLQSQPRMDEATVGNRTECEKTVRTFVDGRLKSYLSALDKFSTDYWDANEVNRYRWTATMLQDLVVAMRTRFHVEMATGDALIGALQNAPTGPLTFVWNEARRIKTTVQYNTVFPDCGVGGTFEGLAHHPDDLATATDGRERAPHYLDWRNDKDYFMYDCYPLSANDDLAVEDRPSFVSLARSPDLPDLKFGYGTNMIVWDNAILERCVLTLGDLGIPRRSMLLLLKDIVAPHKRKDGSAANEAPEPRAAVLGNVLHRLISLQAGPVALNAGTFTASLQGDAYARNDTYNLECHVFGRLRPNDSATHVCVMHYDRDDFDRDQGADAADKEKRRKRKEKWDALKWAVPAHPDTRAADLAAARPGPAPWVVIPYEAKDLIDQMMIPMPGWIKLRPNANPARFESFLNEPVEGTEPYPIMIKALK